jgi:flagellar hook protein FlgE
MGLLSTMTTSLTGLQGAETTIDVVGNNVANANTVGFKQSSVEFATQFSQTQSIGSSPSTASGGTNPRQVGLGVKVAEIAPDFTQGTIEISSNSLDLAIQGDGFFIVAGATAGQEFYTRNGQLKTNSQNELVTVTGQRVVGYGINDDFEIQTNNRVPLTIPLGGSQVAQQTRNVNLLGNLLPDGEIGDTPEIIQSVVLSDNSKEIPSNLATGDVNASEPTDVSTVALAGAITGGAVPTGVTYRYKIAFVDPNGLAGHDEAPPSAEIGPLALAGPDDSIDLTGIPTPADGDFTEMRIYRSADGGAYGLVDQVPVAASYTDVAAATTTALNEDELDLVNYSYFITFSNATVESRPTAQSASVSVSSGNRRVRLENIPQPTGAEFQFINIYRNVDNQPNTFYRVDSFAPPAGPGPINYIDNKEDADIIDPSNILDRNGPKISTALPLVDVSTFNGSSYVDLFPLDPGETATLQFTGSRGKPGLDLATKELTITSTTTVQELLTFMQQALGIETDSGDPDHPLGGNPGGRISADSQLEFESNKGEQNGLSIDESSFNLIVDGVPQGVPMNFTSSQIGNGEGSTSEMIVYDSLGIPLTIRLTTVLESAETGATTYRWFATSPDNQTATGVDTTIGTGLVSFNGQGAFSNATPNAQVTIQRAGVASVTPVTVNIDFAQVTALSSLSDSSVQMSSQDGFPSGTLASFSITESGRIKGVYTNGVTRDLGQIVMARFTNNGGLLQVGDNLWAEGVNSGTPLRGIPGENGNGSITAGAVELSNSDIGQNLVDLILASTQYRGGARVITTAQQLLEELLSLRR